ncbi:MAG: hypothetical protein NZP72_03925 [Geminicoccaceae bacterium]|nr:hypothetical protein [Geminicoccaceae bacterium]
MKIVCLEEPGDLPDYPEHLCVCEGKAEVKLVERLMKQILAQGGGNGKSAAEAPDRGQKNEHEERKFVIVCAGGVDKIRPLLKRLRTRPNAKGLKSITIVADADDKVKGRRAEIWKALGVDDDVASKIAPDEVLVVHGVQCAVWLSPDNESNGRIEDMVMKTLESRIINCVEEVWERARSIRADLGARSSLSSKAKVAVWLALVENQGIGLPTAFEKGLVDLSHPVFEPLRVLLGAQIDP